MAFKKIMSNYCVFLLTCCLFFFSFLFFLLQWIRFHLLMLCYCSCVVMVFLILKLHFIDILRFPITFLLTWTKQIYIYLISNQTKPMKSVQLSFLMRLMTINRFTTIISKHSDRNKQAQRLWRCLVVFILYIIWTVIKFQTINYFNEAHIVQSTNNYNNNNWKRIHPKTGKKNPFSIFITC